MKKGETVKSPARKPVEKKEGKLKTINIKGKEYVMVNERLRYFREKYGNSLGLVTEILKDEGKEVVIKASIIERMINGEGFVVATGIAMEVQGSGYINKTSHYENCETSAWGRALANMGIGIDDSVASANEVADVMAKQSTKPSEFRKPVSKEEPQPEEGKQTSGKMKVMEEARQLIKKLRWKMEVTQKFMGDTSKYTEGDWVTMVQALKEEVKKAKK